MFAFGIIDLRARRLLVARDHFGIKPLYYRVGRDYFAFASELRALRAVADDAPRGSLRAVDQFLKLQYVASPDTIYHEVFALPPASSIEVGFDGQIKPVTTYWRATLQADHSRTSDEWRDEFTEALRESVKAHTVSDVPYGVFLSGGVDSTLVAADLARVVDRPVHAFNIDFEDPGLSERRYAAEAAARIGIKLVSEVATEPSRGHLEQLVAQYGQPFADGSAIPTYLVSRLARGEVPMVLSGDGGDELFAGYDSHAAWRTYRPRMRQHVYRLLARPTLDAARRAALAVIWRISGRRGNETEEWQRIMWTIGDVQRHKLWRRPFRGMVFDAIPSFESSAKGARPESDVSFAQAMDLATYLPSDILTKVDIASMAHGLEVRTPLIDLRMFDVASRLPLTERFGTAPDASTVGKALPKRVLATMMGNSFVYRRKQGFGAPLARWLMPGSPVRSLLDEKLASPDPRLVEWFNLGRIRRVLAAHSRDRSMAGSLWPFLVLAIWLDANPGIEFE